MSLLSLQTLQTHCIDIDIAYMCRLSIINANYLKPVTSESVSLNLTICAIVGDASTI